jgi:hypothetical protein
MAFGRYSHRDRLTLGLTRTGHHPQSLFESTIDNTGVSIRLSTNTIRLGVYID